MAIALRMIGPNVAQPTRDGSRSRDLIAAAHTGYGAKEKQAGRMQPDPHTCKYGACSTPPRWNLWRRAYNRWMQHPWWFGSQRRSCAP